MITKKEKSPLKPRCSLNNKIVSGQALLAKGTLNPSGLKKALVQSFSPLSSAIGGQNVPPPAPVKAYFILKFSFINKRMNLTPYVQHVFFLLKL